MASRRVLAWFGAAVLVGIGLVVRPQLVIGIPLLFAIFVPLEKLWPLRRDQRVTRAGWGTDLAHLVVNGVFVTAGTIVLVVVLIPTPLTLARIAMAPAWLEVGGRWQVRWRFPGLRWIVPTPEWHHWHHSSDPQAREGNFGLPPLDVIFGTASLPRGRWPSGYGAAEPIPRSGFVAHLVWPFRRSPVRVGPGRRGLPA